MTSDELNRRKTLRALGAVAVGTALAGCGSPNGGGTEEDEELETEEAETAIDDSSDG